MCLRFVFLPAVPSVVETVAPLLRLEGRRDLAAAPQAALVERRSPEAELGRLSADRGTAGRNTAPPSHRTALAGHPRDDPALAP